jgi:hypothetical protein
MKAGILPLLPVQWAKLPSASSGFKPLIGGFCERVGRIIVRFLTLHDFNLDHAWSVKWSSVIILGLTLTLTALAAATG